MHRHLKRRQSTVSDNKKCFEYLGQKKNRLNQQRIGFTHFDYSSLSEFITELTDSKFSKSSEY